MTQVAAVSNQLTEVFDITVPHADIEARVEQMLLEKAKKAKMPGFRPGKVPANIVRQSYIGECIEKTIHYFIQKSSQQLLSEKQIKPATQPTYDIKEYAYGNNLELSLTVEKMPTVTLSDYSDIKIEIIECPVSQKTLSEKLKVIYQDVTVYDVAGKNEPVKSGDRLTLTINHSERDKAFKDLFLDNSAIVLDDQFELHKQLIEALNAHKVGDKFSYDVIVPTGKGKKQEKKNVLFNIEFIKHEVKCDRVGEESDFFGEHSEEEKKNFLELFEKKLNDERNFEIYLYHKRMILDKLAESYKFALPKSYVESEFNSIWAQLQNEISVNNEEVTAAEQEDLKKEYLEIAERRVRLGILISEIARIEKITLTQELLRELIYKEAMKHYPYVDQVIKFYNSNKQAVQNLAASGIEDLVVKFFIERQSDKTKVVSEDDLIVLFKNVLPGYESEDDEENKGKKTKKTAKKLEKKDQDEAKAESEDGDVKPASEKKSKANAKKDS